MEESPRFKALRARSRHPRLVFSIVSTSEPIDPHLPAAANPWPVRLSNLWWEARLGISTRGLVDVPFEDAYHYSTMSYRTVFKVLDHLRLTPQDTFLDIGCGKGRVVCCAALRTLRRAAGVDMSPQFVRQARRNSESLRGRRSVIDIQEGAAQDFDYSTVTACLMFNPFGAATLDTVLGAMKRVVQRRSEGMRIAYANPLHVAVLAEHGWLELDARWTPESHGVEHAVNFYRSR